MATVAWAFRFIQSINNIHRELPLWRILLNWKLVLAGVIVLGACSYGGLRVYRHAARGQLLRYAEKEFENRNTRGAAMFAMNLLREDPKNIAACRLMIRITEPWPAETLVWHAKLQDLQPGDLDNCMAWSRAALKTGKTDMAAEALRHVPASRTAGGEFQWQSGQVAWAQGDLQKAEFHLSNAAKADPGNGHFSMDLARLRLSIPGRKRAEGRTALEQMAEHSSERGEALRYLAVDAEKHGQNARARDYFSKLTQQPGSTHEDHMQLLDLLAASHDPSLMKEVEAYQADLERHPAHLSSMVFWMNANKMAKSAIRWVQGLPPDLQHPPNVQAALAQSYAMTGDWTNLSLLSDQGDWGALDYLRIAFRARSLREKGETQQSKDEWNLAVLKASDHAEAIALLCQTVEHWGPKWGREAEELGWRVAADPHAPPSLLRAMQDRFLEEGNTRKFYQLLSRRRQLDPEDVGVRNNYALLSLLLKENEAEAYPATKGLSEENPTDANLASTYAFALYRQGKLDEALKVMGRFPEQQLRLPSVAPYYGVLLAAAHDPRARTYLSLSHQAPLLLPEERELISTAEKTLEAPKR